MRKITIGKNVIERDGNPYVIAEIGNNHQGSVEIAKEMIRIAADCGVNAVKFQKRNNACLYTKEFYSMSYNNSNSFASTYGEHREYLELKKEDYIELIKCARKSNVEIIITLFDLESIEEMKDYDFDAYKVASGDIGNTVLLEKVAQLGKPVLLSTGAAELNEVIIGLETILKYTEDIILFHCVSQYPADKQNLNLNIIKDYMVRFPELIIGYSSHETGITGAQCAYNYGANVLEKHFTLSHNLKGTDQSMSLEPSEMKELVSQLKLIQEMNGLDVKVLNEYEKNAREKLSKSIYAAQQIRKGEKITIDKLCFRSPGTYLPVYRINTIINKVAACDIMEEEPILEEKLEYV